MLSFFKSNNPGVVVLYILYLVLFRVCFAFVPIDSAFVFEHREPLSQMFFGLFKTLGGQYPFISMVLAGILCFIQALLINGMVNENKVTPKKTFLSGLVFVIVCSWFKESLLLSPASLALTFLIICTMKIFALIKKEKSFGDVFDLGFLVAVATLFYFPAVLFIVFAYVGLTTVRPFSYREWIIVFMGFVSPFILVFTYYFWNEQTALLIPNIVNAHHGVLAGLKFTHVDWILFGSLIFIMLAAMAILPTALYSSLIQVRKFSTTLIVLVLLIGISVVFQQTASPSHWILLGLPLAIIFSMVLMQIKSPLVSEVIHLILILLVLAGQYLPLFNIV